MRLGGSPFFEPKWGHRFFSTKKGRLKPVETWGFTVTQLNLSWFIGTNTFTDRPQKSGWRPLKYGTNGPKNGDPNFWSKRPRFEISNLYLFQYCMKLNQPNKFWDNLKPEFCPSVTSISLKFFSTSAALHNHTAWALALSGGTYGTSAMTWSWKNITAHIPLGSCSGGTSSPRKTIKTMGKPCETLGNSLGKCGNTGHPKNHQKPQFRWFSRSGGDPNSKPLRPQWWRGLSECGAHVEVKTQFLGFRCAQFLPKKQHQCYLHKIAGKILRGSYVEKRTLWCHGGWTPEK